MDEEGEATLSVVQPQDEQEITATLTDPDNFTATSEMWQWARGTSRSGPWTDITRTDENSQPLGKSAIYEPIVEDVGKWLRATATYEDGEGSKAKTAQVVSDNPVNARPYANSAPVYDQDPSTTDVVEVSFDEDSKTEGVQMRIAENSAVGTAIGAPVAAKDLGAGREAGNADLHSSRNQRALFSIDAGTGQLRVKEELDFETEPSYSVMVAATDPSRASETASMIQVTIEVTDVNEAPTITSGDTSINHEEESDISTALATYRATDRDSQDTTLRWSLSGGDASKFTIGSGGELRFRASPDFEAPGDSGRDNVYEATVVATDSGGNTASRDVTVKVTNKKEDGTVTLTVPTQLRVGARVTARLTDPDGSIVNVVWSWTGGNGTPGNSSTYTIVMGDDDDNFEGRGNIYRRTCCRWHAES